MELTQCIGVELPLDNSSEPDALLSNIFSVTTVFQGESSTVTLGLVFAIDAASSSK